MGHRLMVSAWKDHVKMQVFGDPLTATDHECSESGPRHGVARGKKRKLEEAEAEESSAYEDRHPMDEENVYVGHRQSIYDISMCKLHRYRQIPDQSLRRSVLICNTVRTIEREMVSEGMELDAAAAASTFLPAIQTDSMTLDPLPAVSDYQPYSVGGVVPMELRAGCDGTDYNRSLIDLDCSSGRATPRPDPGSGRTVPSGGGSGGGAPPAWGEEADERLPNTCISWSSVLDFSSQSDVSEDAWRCPPESTDVTGGPNTSPSASSDSGISTASDEIFGDIDLSLYDFDLLPLSPPNTRVVPPSAEELLCTFAGDRAVAARSCSPPSFVPVARSLPPSTVCCRHEWPSEESDRTAVHLPQPGPP